MKEQFEEQLKDFIFTHATEYTEDVTYLIFNEDDYLEAELTLRFMGNHTYKVNLIFQNGKLEIVASSDHEIYLDADSTSLYQVLFFNSLEIIDEHRKSEDRYNKLVSDVKTCLTE